MSLFDTIRCRDGVRALCAAIDAGKVDVNGPTFEDDMFAVALVVEKHGGLLKSQLLQELASRCKNGRAVLHQ